MQKQKECIKWVIKEFGSNLFSRKSILDVSLPVEIYESRSMLERSASEFGCAPKYLKPVAEADYLTQIKALTGFMCSVFPLGLIM